VLEFVACGANDVALGTVLFADPDAPTRVRDELAAELSAHGFVTVDDAFACAHDEHSPVRVTRELSPM
jgi:dihydroorotate dehydrogenase